MIPEPTITKIHATPDFCKREVVPFNNYKGQRPKSPAKTKGIEKTLRQGKFLIANFATCSYKNNKWLMNGQHTADAIINTGIARPAILSHYEFPATATMMDVAELFMQFDATPSRTKAHKGQAVAAGVGDDMLSWPSQFRNLLVDAFALLFDSGGQLDWNLLGRRKDVDVCVMHLNSNANECRFVYSVFYNAQGNQHRAPHMSHPAIVAAMLTTFQISEHAASQFWTNVRAGEIISSDDPEYVLREHLRDLAAKKWKQKRQDGLFQRIDPQAIYSACIKAWNSCRKGKQLNGLSVRSGVSVPSLV